MLLKAKAINVMSKGRVKNALMKKIFKGHKCAGIDKKSSSPMRKRSKEI
jgi:hypothetical protein